jgi:hypothetical protein
MTQRNAYNAQPAFGNLPMISSHELARIITEHNFWKKPITNKAMMRMIEAELGDNQWAVMGLEQFSSSYNPIVLYVFDEMMEIMIRDESDEVKAICRQRMASRK